MDLTNTGNLRATFRKNIKRFNRTMNLRLFEHLCRSDGKLPSPAWLSAARTCPRQVSQGVPLLHKRLRLVGFYDDDRLGGGSPAATSI